MNKYCIGKGEKNSPTEAFIQYFPYYLQVDFDRFGLRTKVDDAHKLGLGELSKHF